MGDIRLRERQIHPAITMMVIENKDDEVGRYAKSTDSPIPQ